MASSVGYKRKIALVIGIDHYSGDSLKYCTNDATDLAFTLQNIGFKISLGLDCDLIKFQNKIDTFVDTIEPDDLVLFYFAGHGKQNDDENYLLPSVYDYSGRKHDYMVNNGINVQHIMNKIKEKKCRTTIYLFDCFRSKIGAGSSNSKQGLSSVNAPAETFIVFACAPGTILLDETKNNNNGCFIENLLKHIATSDKDIEELMMNVAGDVNRQTKGIQIPYQRSSLTGKVYLKKNNNQESNETSLLSKPPAHTNRELERRIMTDQDEPSLLYNSMKLTDADMEIVAYYLLKDNTTLTELNLCWNQIEDRGAKYLSKGLQNNKTLTTLNLLNNQIGDKGAQYLGEALQKNKTLTKLELYENQIGDEGAQYLGEALQKNTTLTKLDLSYNRIRAEGAKNLGKALTLTTLILSSNQIEAQGAKHLGEGLQNNTKLTSLNLSSNHIEAQGAKNLGEALQKNRTLTQLDLSSNQIGDQGAKDLGEALQDNTTLTTLNLDKNQIGDQGAKDLGVALKNNTKLAQLDLAYNEIGEQGAKDLGEELQNNRTLTSVNLDDNPVGLKWQEYLRELTRNRSLSIDLPDNSIDSEKYYVIS
ncbi:unnamed protein product [Adineta steineri]|uniref:Peptidase C14A caspase catalytic domain-containing protein n=1 Tax=Adineta steineri TaxID=433720 RepID=A0A814P6V5_9BILA|nr:unnamed protein product [Adineta steineri]